MAEKGGEEGEGEAVERPHRDPKWRDSSVLPGAARWKGKGPKAKAVKPSGRSDWHVGPARFPQHPGHSAGKNVVAVSRLPS